MEQAVQLMSFESDLRSEFADPRRRLALETASGIAVGYALDSTRIELLLRTLAHD
jgi:hypothetical protein